MRVLDCQSKQPPSASENGSLSRQDSGEIQQPHRISSLTFQLFSFESHFRDAVRPKLWFMRLFSQSQSSVSSSVGSPPCKVFPTV